MPSPAKEKGSGERRRAAAASSSPSPLLLLPSLPPASVLRALFDCLRRAHADPAVAAIVITGEGDRAFSAGFDIAQFASSSSSGGGGGGGIDHSINAAFCDLIESGPKPTVAAIRALALGGGYICGSSHDISEDVPLPNLLAMRDTVHSYRLPRQ